AGPHRLRAHSPRARRAGRDPRAPDDARARGATARARPRHRGSLPGGARDGPRRARVAPRPPPRQGRRGYMTPPPSARLDDPERDVWVRSYAVTHPPDLHIHERAFADWNQLAYAVR